MIKATRIETSRASMGVSAGLMTLEGEIKLPRLYADAYAGESASS